jgi:hypothetical protein
MKHSISPYPENVRVAERTKEESDIIFNGRIIGSANYILNWGTDWQGYFNLKPHLSKFFETKTEAVKHVIQLYENFEPEEKVLVANQVAAMRLGDEVIIYFPEGKMRMSIIDYRRKVFQLEEEFGKEIVFI